MANAENFSLQSPQAVAERHVEVFKNYPAQFVGVMSRRQQDGSQGAAVLFWIGAKDLEAPGSHGAPRSLGVPVMTREDIVQAFLPEHLKRLAQPVEQIRRRRERKEARG